MVGVAERWPSLLVMKVRACAPARIAGVADHVTDADALPLRDVIAAQVAVSDLHEASWRSNDDVEPVCGSPRSSKRHNAAAPSGANGHPRSTMSRVVVSGVITRRP